MITDKEGRDRRADVPITRLRWNGRSTQYQGNDDIRTSFFHHYLGFLFITQFRYR